jgi:glucose-6-phosphate isomerase
VYCAAPLEFDFTTLDHVYPLSHGGAHVPGMPNIVIETDKMSEMVYGQMVYFFEKACAISGYLLGVNPFNQPGVEVYKKNMFKLLGKPTK